MVMQQGDDWRLDRRKLVEGHTLTWETWRAPKTTWDHDHCVLCWAKIADWSADDVQPEAYVDKERSEWLCAACANEFRDLLKLRLIGGPAAA